jgi:hypothetical protein
MSVVTSEGQTVLHLAVISGSHETVANVCAVHEGAQGACVTDGAGDTPLHCALSRGIRGEINFDQLCKITAALVSAGAGRDAQNASGVTPFQMLGEAHLGQGREDDFNSNQIFEAQGLGFMLCAEMYGSLCVYCVEGLGFMLCAEMYGSLCV